MSVFHLSYVDFYVFYQFSMFCHNLSFWALSKFEFLSCYNFFDQKKFKLKKIATKFVKSQLSLLSKLSLLSLLTLISLLLLLLLMSIISLLSLLSLGR